MKLLKSMLVILVVMMTAQEIANAQISTPRRNNQQQTGQAQELTGRKQFTWDKFFLGGNFGGNLGLINNGFGGGGTQYLLLSPILGYNVNEKLAVGAGPMFTFIKYSNSPGFSVWGTRAMARYTVYQNLFASAELSNSWFKCAGETTSVRSFPIGGGYRQRLAGRSNLVAEVMYDILYRADGGVATNPCVFDPGTPFIYRIGFNVGF